MITELRKKSQITIPRELVSKLGLREGDKLEIIEKDGVIQIMPVVVYPKKYLDELKEEITDIKTKIKSGDQPVFDNVDDLFKQLDSEDIVQQRQNEPTEHRKLHCCQRRDFSINTRACS
ncbi:AbrB/MazE/SpoVT family DNA-binding domain-containing protein [Desulfoscipio gibsoniae]|uniref:Looped-hinge helix DNA binding domain, AbrB family n=1 Tax=Desulfoscipio gibsoniae DSM 7213 TaxID=767817 RepID=R4KEK8_9FIRM|nr:looped-hinge helix DNA binding domain, AbrB family [Desulfoscipio gibsoniae DSM 7213]